MTAADVVRELYGATERGDAATALGLIHEDVEVIYRGVVPELRGQDFSGHRGVGHVMATVTAEFSDFRATPAEIKPIDDERVLVAVSQRGTGRASGAEVRRTVGQIWTVREGKAVRWEIYEDLDQAARAAAGDAW